MSGEATIGRNIRRIRTLRKLSVKAAAERAGITAPHLSRIELGRRPVDRRSLLVAIAGALDVSPPELTKDTTDDLPGTVGDDAIRAVRQALHGVLAGVPGGTVQSFEQLWSRVDEIGRARQACEYDFMGAALPGLIADLHTSIAHGVHDGDLLRLAAPLHVLGTQTFLHGARASDDLCLTAASLARESAERLDEPVSLGLAAFGVHGALLASGSFRPAAAILAGVPASTGDEQLDGMLTLSAGMLASADGRPADAQAALRQAQELAARTGEGNRHYMAFGPTNVKLWEQSAVLEVGEYEHTAALSETIDPARITTTARLARYWVNYGRAQARLRGHRGDAVRSLRIAESASPDTFRRDPFTRDTVTELLNRPQRDTEGRELRGMAYRMGITRKN